MKKNVFVAFGGKSPERDVSVITGIQSIRAIDKDKYNVYPLYIDKTGKMYVDKHLTKIENIKNFNSKKYKESHFVLGDNHIHVNGIVKTKIQVDCVLMCFHGSQYEGGSFQGVLDLCSIPYTSSDVLGSSVGMNKAMQKQIAMSVNVPIVPFELVPKSSREDLKKLFTLSDLLIVKPNDLGSSIGISSCASEKEVVDALGLVFTYSNEAIVEKHLQEFYELNIAVFLFENELILSSIEKPIKMNEFLTFEDKYMSSSKFGSKNVGMKNLSRQLPAEIDSETEEKVKAYASKMYQALGLNSVCRFDFLVENGEIYFNEVNTIPGSLAFYLFENQGINFPTLLDMMINEAQRGMTERNRIIRNINTKVF